jgi:hypothetical protein
MTTAATQQRMTRAFAIYHSSRVDCTCSSDGRTHEPGCEISKAWCQAWDASAETSPNPEALAQSQREALLHSRRWSPDVSARIAQLGPAPDSLRGTR